MAKKTEHVFVTFHKIEVVELQTVSSSFAIF